MIHAAHYQRNVHVQKQMPMVSLLTDLSTNKDFDYKHEYKEQNLHLYPNISWSGPYGTHFRMGAEHRIGKTVGDRNSHSALSLQLEQPLTKKFWGNDSRLQDYLVEQNLESAKAHLKEVVETTLYETIYAYYRYQYERLIWQYRSHQFEHVQKMFQHIEVKIQQGLLAPVEKEQAHLQLLQAELALEQAQGEFSHHKHRLLELAPGVANICAAKLPKLSLTQLQTDLALLSEKMSAYDSRLKNLQQHSQQLQLERQVLKSAQGIDVRFRGVANIGRYHEPGAHPWYVTKDYSAHITIEIPIRVAPELNWQDYQNRQHYEQVQLEISHYKSEIRHKAQDLERKILLLTKQVQVAKKAKEVALQSYQSMQKRLDLGRASAYDVGVYRDKAFDTNLQYLSLYLQLLDYQLQMDKQTGELYHKWKSIVGFKQYV